MNWPGNFSLLGVETFDDPINTQKIIQLQRPMCLLIVSVTQGAVDVWLGNYRGQLPATPHFHFGQTNKPEWVPLPLNITDLTLKASGNTGTTVVASIIVGGPPV